MEQLYKIYFSPTKTTKKILDGIAFGLSSRLVEEIDLTNFNSTEEKRRIINGVALIGVPVYAGRVPKVAVERLKNIQAENVPAIIVVVYGNRYFDDALVELKNISLESGFKPLAATAFIGEHSFSTEEKPIGLNRPDEADLKKAEAFGKMCGTINRNINEWKIVDVPGNIELKDHPVFPSIAPETDVQLCKLCEKCMSACPTGAITLDGIIKTKIEDCILCAACVKSCALGARSLSNDFINGIREKLFANCKDRKEPECFLN